MGRIARIVPSSQLGRRGCHVTCRVKQAFDLYTGGVLLLLVLRASNHTTRNVKDRQRFFYIQVEYDVFVTHCADGVAAVERG